MYTHYNDILLLFSACKPWSRGMSHDTFTNKFAYVFTLTTFTFSEIWRIVE